MAYVRLAVMLCGLLVLQQEVELPESQQEVPLLQQQLWLAMQHKGSACQVVQSSPYYRFDSC